MQKDKLEPLQRIALCFSGGGYRAATFSLGTLSYFNEVRFMKKPLLNCVEGMSTVSGGTLAGAAYAAQTGNGKTFGQFYRDFYRWLEEDQLLDTALRKLQSNEVWKQSPKRRSLINAFALSYREMVTEATMASLEGHPHLKDICFNGTDFSFGLAFRFQTTGDFGNYRLASPALDALKGRVKVADAMATSSCFPLGFEPMLLPDDYFDDHRSEAYKTLKAQDHMRLGTGLMDGGIVDNQGIGSIMNADARRERAGKGEQFDLIMVCDVASYKMVPWEPAQEKVEGESGSFASLWSALTNRRFGLVTSIVLLLLTLGLLWVGLRTGIDPGRAKLLIGAAWFTSVLFVLVFLVWLLFRISLVGAGFFLRLLDWQILPGFMRGKLHFFSRLKFHLLSRMVKDRLTSGAKMINDIFLKQIRRLNYNLFYTKDTLKNRRITSLIYELTMEDFLKNVSDEKTEEMRKEESAILPDPSEKLFKAAQVASEMGTTLWFTEEDRKVQRLRNLVACGQFTTCYNLLDYLVKLPGELKNEEVNEVIGQLRKDWRSFNDDPYWLVDKLRREAAVA